MNGIAEKRIRVTTTFPAHDGKFVLKYFMLTTIRAYPKVEAPTPARMTQEWPSVAPLGVDSRHQPKRSTAAARVSACTLASKDAAHGISHELTSRTHHGSGGP